MDRRRPSSLGRFLGFQGIVDLVNIVADRADSNLGCFRDALKCLLKTGHEKIDVRHDVRVAVEADAHGACIASESDPEPHALHEGHCGVDRSNACAVEIERELRPWHVGYDRVYWSAHGLRA